MRGLVLASRSPRRRELLAKAGYEFEVVTADTEETSSRHLTPREITLWNARRKALAVCSRCRNDVVLGADTIVALNGEPIGKPKNVDVAMETLRKLSGRAHEVYSAVFVCDAAQRTQASFVEASRVHFRRLTDKQIREYLSRINPLDKAGAYAAQGHGTEIIAEIRGSYTNVVGLPMDETLEALALFGVSPERAR